MKTKTEIADFIYFICDFYVAYKDLLGLTHEQARKKTEEAYRDAREWLYELPPFGNNKEV